MTPFEIVPGWRIGTQDRQFTLEYLQTSKGVRSKPSWRAMGFYGRIEHALEAYVSEALRRSGEPLPAALVEVRAQVECIMARLQGAPSA